MSIPASSKRFLTVVTYSPRIFTKSARLGLLIQIRADFVKIRGEYVTTVKNRFDEAGINIPYPQRDISGGLDFENVEGIVEPADD